MSAQRLIIEERLVTFAAGKRSIGRMRMFVPLQFALDGETFVAKTTEILGEFVVRKHDVFVECFFVTENDIAHKAQFWAGIFQVELLVKRAPGC